MGYLLDQIRLHGESQELKDTIVRLAIAHGIVTPYTAYLVTEPDSVASRPMTTPMANGIDAAGIPSRRAFRAQVAKKTLTPVSSGSGGGGAAVDASEAARSLQEADAGFPVVGGAEEGDDGRAGGLGGSMR